MTLKKSLTSETKEITICYWLYWLYIGYIINNLIWKKEQLFKLKISISGSRKTLFLLKNYLGCELCGANLKQCLLICADALIFWEVIQA